MVETQCLGCSFLFLLLCDICGGVNTLEQPLTFQLFSLLWGANLMLCIEQPGLKNVIFSEKGLIEVFKRQGINGRKPSD
jgi:hypothetical protein